MAWSDITSWIGVKAAGLKVLASDFNLLNDNAKKIYDNTVYLKGAFESPVIGQSLKMLDAYKPIAADHPWLCMSLSDRTLSIANYSADFIAERRSRKVVYDELNTNVSSFAGTWSGNVFTLTSNTANNAMIAELAEDWLFAGSPTTNWRILSDGTNEFNITGISASARTVTVNLDSKTASGTGISIYLYRVYGSTTSCRHFSWAGLGLYMTGQNKITGLRRRDALKDHNHDYYSPQNGTSSNPAYNLSNPPQSNYALQKTTLNVNVLTRSKTEIESATAMLYLYVGAYAT
ncbi:MAG: hypothetical protein CVV49_08800 [Spirochaetae bacterium HGW-Spirochaetae-5]|nr:MAG: hypothetical protein CVV49_08800 [Spirochaetae bacterium HGW-Spirochaetae-5]